MEREKLRVCAILSHYKRVHLTMTCLEHLLAQAYPVCRIIVVDNQSQDGSYDDLLAFANQQKEREGMPQIDILQNQRNLGNAGGIAKAMTAALADDHVDAVWVLDDDSWSEPTALAELMRAKAEDLQAQWPCVLVSLVVDLKKDGELTWPLPLQRAGDQEEDWFHAMRKIDLPTENIIKSRGCFLGALVPREILQATGVPTTALFIRGEDEELPWRVRAKGFATFTIQSSVMHHPMPPRPLHRINLGARSFYYEPGLDPYRLYFKVRNWAWLEREKKRGGGYAPRFVHCSGYVVLAMWCMLCYEEFSWGRLSAVMRGLLRGYFGVLSPK